MSDGCMQPGANDKLDLGLYSGIARFTSPRAPEKFRSTLGAGDANTVILNGTFSRHMSKIPGTRPKSGKKNNNPPKTVPQGSATAKIPEKN